METTLPPTENRTLAPTSAEAIVAEAAAAYFEECRSRVRPFVDRTFSLPGSARLHRHALGWDLLRAPANVALSVPQVGLKVGSGAARALGRNRLAGWLDRNLFLETAVARELRWRITTELLRQPCRDGSREAREDGLAEAILAHPEVRALLARAAEATAGHEQDPVFRQRLEAALTEYAGTRAAAAEITTGLVALGTGALAFQQATPGAFALGPAIAGSLAQGGAIASFPLGSAMGGFWYGLFPAHVSPLLAAGTTAGTMGVAAIATAFAGIISDPVQRALGLHERRLTALIDNLESNFRPGRREAGFVTYDLYVARLLDLGDILVAVGRLFRPA
ncbi:DUF6635 family protein [Propylenella binzhouense]|uniref:Uncharacterized protein n=1 Tax=Propylenella binzhouense TaxID=2555902 RepID=A0A964T791_9HYPH|nr:DUF6635 family protein [Propylenella binzhouense]MYZ49124.1 hypothetical protein [Propylenella binzhouense]